MESEGKQPGFMTAMGQFEREMDALMHPVTREKLIEATERLLVGMFEFSIEEAVARTNILAEKNDIPTDHELEDFSDSLPEMLKLGLFDSLIEEYMIMFGVEEFDKWIGPFVRSVLYGHIKESASLEHLTECPQRFCPTRIIKLMFRDRLLDEKAVIDKNVEYLPFSNEIVHMNMSVVRELKAVGAFSKTEAEDLIGDYRWWLESIDDGAVNFDRKMFKD